MKQVKWKLIALVITGLFVWTTGAIAVYEMFFRVDMVRVLPDGTVEYITDCPVLPVEKQ